MIFGSPDLVNALLGWLTAKYGDAIVNAGARRVLGSTQRRAFTHVVNSAIERAAASAGQNLTHRQRDELVRIVRKHRTRIVNINDFTEVDNLVLAVLETIPSLHSFPVDRRQFAAALAYWISDGVARDAMAGGELAPLADYSRFSELFELGARSVAALDRLEPLLGRIDETVAMLRAAEEQRTERSAQFPSAFGTLVTERSRKFIGRTQFIADIDAGLTSLGDSGYLLITGEPGIGKTSLIAYLVKKRGYICYFNSRIEGTTSQDDFIASVREQLVRRYGLSEALLSDTLSSVNLQRVIQLAGESATQRSPLIIALDALDEAVESKRDSNRLSLPRTLPPHTFIIATSRELADDGLLVDNRCPLHLADDSPENLRDIASYILARLQAPEQSTPWQIDPDELAEILTARSEGNFLYASLVLEDIRMGRLSPQAFDDPRNLPEGLRAYYRMHWKIMQDRWPVALRDHYEAAIRCLAVMQEPVPLGALADFAPDGVDEGIARHVVGEWRQFLNTRLDSKHEEALYSVYHATFVEFLRDEGPGLRPYEEHVYQKQLGMVAHLLADG